MQVTELLAKPITEKIYTQLSGQVQLLQAKGVIPQLAIILVGDNPASLVYIGHKQKIAGRLGINTRLYQYPVNITEAELLANINNLNNDSNINAVICQLPLPGHINAHKIAEAINPYKDVDGLHPLNRGRLLSGDNEFYFTPCTALAVMELLRFYQRPPAAKKALVIGSSAIVGQPVAQLLLQATATVTIAHSATANLANELAMADIIVSAAGKPHFIKSSQLKAGTVVIDVGISRTDSGLVGDMLLDDATPAAYSPVPGGVGPLTVAMLMANTVKAAHN
ncbi:MAG: bifunctional 5,10-methylenetetrahydrofolate dehydrogenase/5,10-methenyltetrahydrofolate cyclohydrolase [Spirochaetaceae bacterium]|nr:bifunctional 5,10-methylenetetrahydrofolate dehydrogenase/5,10-methenyltetrahydrofolate cyclohydrolase [Spirochaetaceae bacterium]